MSVERNLPLVRERKEAILAGDAARIAEQKKLGKLTARERIGLALDPQSFVELDALKSEAGVVTGYGLINGAPVYVYAQDVTVKGASMKSAHAEKIEKVLSLAAKTGCPALSIIDTEGADLADGVKALDSYARIAKATAALSGVVPQIAVVLGECGGTASAVAEMNDIVILGGKGCMFMNGAQLVSLCGKNVSLDEIGGIDASMKSGAAQLTAATEEEAIALARKVIAMMPANNMDEAVFECGDDMNRAIAAAEADGDVLELIKELADNGEVVELYSDFAASMVTALIKMGGRTVGVIANQPAKDEGRLTVYGMKKAAALVSFCDAFTVPVLSIVNSNGVKINANPQGEIIRAGAQLMYATTDCSAPRIALVTGNAVGMAYTAMASRSANDMVYAWPGAMISATTAKIAVQLTMGDQLNGVEDVNAKRAELEAKYADEIADGVHAAEQGYVDDVIEPASTRVMICAALEMLASKREEKPAKKHGVTTL